MNVLPSDPPEVRVIRKNGRIITLPLITRADLAAAHEEGYDRAIQDAERVKTGLSPNKYNPYLEPETENAS